MRHRAWFGVTARTPYHMHQDSSDFDLSLQYHLRPHAFTYMCCCLERQVSESQQECQDIVLAALPITFIFLSELSFE